MGRKPRHSPGEYLPLYWAGDKGFDAVYGHVDRPTFARKVECETGLSLPKNFAMHHLWARHVWADQISRGTLGIDTTARLQARKNMGAFAVTVAIYSDAIVKTLWPETETAEKVRQ